MKYDDPFPPRIHQEAQYRLRRALTNSRQSIPPRIHQEAQYGFVELETVEMAEAVLAKLDGMLVNNNPVQFRRPNDQAAVKQVPGMAPRRRIYLY